jgi:hypothetical protein
MRETNLKEAIGALWRLQHTHPMKQTKPPHLP